MAKTEVALSHCIWLASTNVVSMYEVGYSWVLTSVVFAAFLDQDLWPQFFLRGFKFGSTSHCSFIQSGFWSDFQVLCLNNWIEQVEILSMYMQQSWSIQCWTKFPVLCQSCFTSTFTALWCRKSLFFRQPSLDSFLRTNKKNIHELFDASFEESSLADYTLDEGCWDILVLKSSCSLIWQTPCWTFLEEVSNISPVPSYLIPKV